MPSTAAIRPTLAIHPSDFHPNAEGHALLARRLAEALWPLPCFNRFWDRPLDHLACVSVDGYLIGMSDVTRILEQIEEGDGIAAERLLPLIYDELKRLAAAECTRKVREIRFRPPRCSRSVCAARRRQASAKLAKSRPLLRRGGRGDEAYFDRTCAANGVRNAGATGNALTSRT